MKIDGNTILITGGSSGIGKGLVRFFYKHKNKLIVIARDQAKLISLQQEMPDIFIQQCDLSNEIEIKAFIDTCKEMHPDINIIINNAGVENNYLFEGKSILDYKIIKDEIAINLTAPILLTNSLLPLLINKEQAAIINITSALIYTPKTNAAVYSATKVGLHHFTLALRTQLKNTSVKVIELIPPLTDTPMTISNPHRKLSVQKLVEEFAQAFQKDKEEIRIGDTRWIYLLSRIAPFILNFIVQNRYSKSISKQSPSKATKNV